MNEQVKPATVPEGFVPVPSEVVEFLHGTAPLDGVWFGERHPDERGAFWWRKRLAAAPKPEQQQEAPELTEKAIERLQFCKVSGQVPSHWIREMARRLHQQQEAPELTDEEIKAIYDVPHSKMHMRGIRLVLAADRARRS